MKKITVAQYAKNHGISDQAVRKRIKSGGIPESRIKKEVLPDTVREQVFILVEDKSCDNCYYGTGTDYYSEDAECQGDNCIDNNYFCWVKKESK
jgi:hypothetical protein